MDKVRVDHGDVWWDTTIHGNALAMASFGKPISKKTADRLVSGCWKVPRPTALPRANPFLSTLRFINTQGFGSHLSPEIDPIADVDIELTYGRRITDQEALSDYTRPSGRSFNTHMDQLLWPQTDLALHLKKRSAFINITLEDITRITDRFDIIYRIDSDSEAVPAPPDRSLIGR